jgi:hypothetical protein
LGYDDRTSVTGSSWVAIRHEGCIYLADFKTNRPPEEAERLKQLLRAAQDAQSEKAEQAEQASMVLRIRAKINAHQDPCTNICLQETAPDEPVIMIAEDWRPSMLVVRVGGGAWTPASPHQLYMYYDFMMKSRKSKPASRAYCNSAHTTLCKTTTNGRKLDIGDECFEYQTFNKLPDEVCPHQSLLVAASAYFLGTEKPRFGYKLDMTDGVVKIEDRVQKQKSVEVMPVSLVPDSMWNTDLLRAYPSSAMHPHWARIIIGVPAIFGYHNSYIDGVFKALMMEMQINLAKLNDDGVRIIARCGILSEAAAVLKGETVGPKRPGCSLDELMALYAPETEPHEPQTEPREALNSWEDVTTPRTNKDSVYTPSNTSTVTFGNHNRKSHRRTTKT